MWVQYQRESKHLLKALTKQAARSDDEDCPMPERGGKPWKDYRFSPEFENFVKSKKARKMAKLFGGAPEAYTGFVEANAGFKPFELVEKWAADNRQDLNVVLKRLLQQKMTKVASATQQGSEKLNALLAQHPNLSVKDLLLKIKD